MRIVILTIAVFFKAMTMANCQSFPLLMLSNTIPTNSPAVTNNESADKTNNIVSVIQMRGGIPMSAGILNLARQAGVNYIIDARLSKWWSMLDSDGNTTHEPTLNFRWENLSAKQALLQLLEEHHLVLLEDPFTSVARITYTNQIVNPDEASLIGSETNMVTCSDCIIRFQDIPITSTIENLARQAGVNYALDPKIGYGLPDIHGQTNNEPSLNVYWNNVTPIQGLVAVCYAYELVIARVPTSGVWLIRAKDHPLTNFVNASLLGSDMNEATTLRFDNVPLYAVLKSLIEQGQVNAVLDPKLSDYVDPTDQKDNNALMVSLRWDYTTPKQALVALCDNYDLEIVKDSATGVVRIEPKE